MSNTFQRMNDHRAYHRIPLATYPQEGLPERIGAAAERQHKAIGRATLLKLNTEIRQAENDLIYADESRKPELAEELAKLEKQREQMLDAMNDRVIEPNDKMLADFAPADSLDQESTRDFGAMINRDEINSGHE